MTARITYKNFLHGIFQVLSNLPRFFSADTEMITGTPHLPPGLGYKTAEDVAGMRRDFIIRRLP